MSTSRRKTLELDCKDESVSQNKKSLFSLETNGRVISLERVNTQTNKKMKEGPVEGVEFVSEENDGWVERDPTGENGEEENWLEIDNGTEVGNAVGVVEGGGVGTEVGNGVGGIGSEEHVPLRQKMSTTSEYPLALYPPPNRMKFVDEADASK